MKRQEKNVREMPAVLCLKSMFFFLGFFSKAHLPGFFVGGALFASVSLEAICISS